MYWHGEVGILYEERSLVPRDQLAAAAKKEGGLKRLLYNFFTSKPTTVGEKEGIMRIEVAEGKEDNLHEAFEIYLRRELKVVHSQLEEEEEYLELQRRRYRETLYSLCQAWYRRLPPISTTTTQFSESQKPINPGLFVGQYSVHGSEFVRVEVLEGGGAYLRGTKVTGDPNVPFDQTTFEVTGPECLVISLENQTSCTLLTRILRSTGETNETEAIEFQVSESSVCSALLIVLTHNPPLPPLTFLIDSPHNLTSTQCHGWSGILARIHCAYLLPAGANPFFTF